MKNNFPQGHDLLQVVVQYVDFFFFFAFRSHFIWSLKQNIIKLFEIGHKYESIILCILLCEWSLTICKGLASVLSLEAYFSKSGTHSEFLGLVVHQTYFRWQKEIRWKSVISKLYFNNLDLLYKRLWQNLKQLLGI